MAAAWITGAYDAYQAGQTVYQAGDDMGLWSDDNTASLQAERAKIYAQYLAGLDEYAKQVALELISRGADVNQYSASELDIDQMAKNYVVGRVREYAGLYQQAAAQGADILQAGAAEALAERQRLAEDAQDGTITWRRSPKYSTPNPAATPWYVTLALVAIVVLLLRK